MLVLWALHLDPFVTVFTPKTSSHTALIIQIPGYWATIHVCVYLPTSGREHDFLAELSNLESTLTELSEAHPSSPIFVRGDSNVNRNNSNRVILFKHFMKRFSLLRVFMHHDTYHHFVGDGQYDSDIDVILHTHQVDVRESVISIRCVKDHPDMLSHHDMVLSVCSVPPVPHHCPGAAKDDLVTAPRIPNKRERIVWSDVGIDSYESQISPILRQIRQDWLHPQSQASISVLLKLTNHALSSAARATNKAVSLSSKPVLKSKSTPRSIRLSCQRLKRAHRCWKNATPDNVPASRVAYSIALKNYRQAVRRTRLEQNTSRDDQLMTILSDNPSSLYSFIKSSRNTSNTLVEKLSVGEKIYTGNNVADGFYDAMTSLKTYNPADLENESVADQITTYKHIMKLAMIKQPIPPISIEIAVELLCRLKKNVKDFYSITALHYINA